MGRRSTRHVKPEDEGDEPSPNKASSREKPEPAKEKKKKKKKHKKNKENRDKTSAAAEAASSSTINVTFQRKREDGSTSLAILTPAEGPGASPEKPVTLGMLLDRVRTGTSSLSSFREDRRNLAKPMHPIYYGGYSSHGPTHDSTFANLTEAESVMVGPYFDFRSLENEELIRSVCGSDYSVTFVDHLLDLFEGKEVTHTVSSSTQKVENKKVEKETGDKEEIDFEFLRTLEQDGIDVSFMSTLQAAYELRQEQEMKDLSLEQQLELTAHLIDSLASAQKARLSLPPPPSLHLVPPPGEREQRLASRVVNNLTQLTQQVAPQAVLDVGQVRRAMGVTAPQSQGLALLPVSPPVLTNPIPSSEMRPNGVEWMECK